MFSVIAILSSMQRSRVVLLPLEQHERFYAERWLQYAGHEDFTVTKQIFPLAAADWIVRNVRHAVRTGHLKPTSNTLKSYIEQLAKTGSHISIGNRGTLQWQTYFAPHHLYRQEESHIHQVTEGNERRSDVLSIDELSSHIAPVRELLLYWLQGRKLLYNEWLALVEERMKEYNANQVATSNTLTLEMLKSIWCWLLMKGYIRLRSAVEWNTCSASASDLKLRCLRCYETKLVHAERVCHYCGEKCYYCSSCLQMGRSRTCSPLVITRYQSPIVKQLTYRDVSPESLLQLDRFGLSDAQHMATTAALSFVHNHLLNSYGTKAEAGNNETKKNLKGNKATDRHSIDQMKPSKLQRYKQMLSHLGKGGESSRGQMSSQFLLWAVTGAGKTEMIFPLIAYMIELGGSVLVATPRRDVVLELSPRLQKAFPELSIVTLYGGSQDRWRQGQLTLATTHQLMRFQYAFDLVIIDELDAFPYHGDERLYRVASKARVPQGVTLLLSATPPAYLQKEINSGRLAHVKLPVRYHRHPLPVPVRLKVPLITEQLSKQLIPNNIREALARSIKEGAQIFVFLQRIVHTEAYAKLMRNMFPHINIQATSSQDVDRSNKVAAFRRREIRILVTTTILERGVTVPRSHVYICDAEDELFDEAALVQMAGRAGRSGDAPNGAVYFLSQQWSSAQKQAIRQIRTMNKLALQQGYLLPQYTERQASKGNAYEKR